MIYPIGSNGLGQTDDAAERAAQLAQDAADAAQAGDEAAAEAAAKAAAQAAQEALDVAPVDPGAGTDVTTVPTTEKKFPFLLVGLGVLGIVLLMKK